MKSPVKAICFVGQKNTLENMEEKKDYKEVEDKQLFPILYSQNQTLGLNITLRASHDITPNYD